ncbi:MAG: Crp/Fnr family transcriptional regulator [Solobacterium sp.]|nr:Crp/Fnr family transcriptional regulator [Solobacterium sp.]
MNIQQIKNINLFHGLNEEEVTKALTYLNAYEKTYRKNSTIFHAGDYIHEMGIVLEGSVTIENNDIWGNKTILNMIKKNDSFAESYAYLHDMPLLIDVIANEKTTILFLEINVLANSLKNKPNWAITILQNLCFLSSHKNLHLSQRSFHTSSKSIRARVMSYLHSLSIQLQSKEFEIPFNRQQLADYLNVERTALSKELKRMKENNLILYHKNHFLILANKDDQL